jgi:carboxymethylenebutenolidase
LKKLAIILTSLMCLLACNRANAQEWAKAKLEKSPRHLEWIDVQQGDRKLKCFIAYPQVKEKATSVVVVHEIFGMSDWVREVCDELAAQGFIAIAPDLLSGKPGEDTSKYKSVDDVRTAVHDLQSKQISADLSAVSSYVSHLPAANGKVATAGFCWGGAQVWLEMVTNPNMKAGFVFYGTPDAVKADDEMNKISAPIYGFYGEKDARVTSTVDDTIARMKKAGKSYTPAIYKEAGHGFMRSGEAPDATAPDHQAHTEGWSTLTKALRGI